jgi:anaerobic selenocysteine-containing dehydrogenase
MKTFLHKHGTKNKPAAAISRRDFLKYSGAVGGAFLFGLQEDLVMASSKSQVAFVHRRSGSRVDPQ